MNEKRKLGKAPIVTHKLHFCGSRISLVVTLMSTQIKYSTAIFLGIFSFCSFCNVTDRYLCQSHCLCLKLTSIFLYLWSHFSVLNVDTLHFARWLHPFRNAWVQPRFLMGLWCFFVFLYVMFSRSLFVGCPRSCGHCIVCPSIDDFLLPHWYIQTFHYLVHESLNAFQSYQTVNEYTALNT